MFVRIYTTQTGYFVRCHVHGNVAPEHPLGATQLTTPDQEQAVHEYCELAATKSDRDRQDEKRSKTGVFTGSYAINPVNEEKDSDLDRRLRFDQLRHRRHHGRARSRYS